MRRVLQENAVYIKGVNQINTTQRMHEKYGAKGPGDGRGN